MRVQRSHLSFFFIAAVACFLIALLIATGTVDSSGRVRGSQVAFCH